MVRFPHWQGPKSPIEKRNFSKPLAFKKGFLISNGPFLTLNIPPKPSQHTSNPETCIFFSKIWSIFHRKRKIRKNMQWVTFWVAADSPEKTMEMFVSEEAVSESRCLSIIYKQSKVCETFEKDLKCTRRRQVFQNWSP